VSAQMQMYLGGISVTALYKYNASAVFIFARSYLQKKIKATLKESNPIKNPQRNLKIKN
jgi:hypothetical protein